MNIWNEFTETYLKPSVKICSESDYTFDEELDNCDSDENEDVNDENVINRNFINNLLKIQQMN